MIENTREICMTRSCRFLDRKSVSIGNRISNLVFGSPSAIRANGGRHASFSSMIAGGSLPERSARGAAVYHLDYTPSLRKPFLPRIWISEPSYDLDSGRLIGREYVSSYPCDGDSNGVKAYQWGLNYFSEALKYSDPEFMEIRLECFRAAEILFLHALLRGCKEAAVKLGIIYESDLCGGCYYGKTFTNESEMWLYLHAKAVECYSIGVELGESESLRRMGLMVSSGKGCAKNPTLAFQMLRQAFMAADDCDDCANRGYAALHIARAYESGEGCRHSFKKAYQWYRAAEEDLSFIVEEGAWHYKKPKQQAILGARRMRQELLGCC